MSKRQFIPTYGYFIIGGFILILGLTIGGLKLQSEKYHQDKLEKDKQTQSELLRPQKQREKEAAIKRVEYEDIKIDNKKDMRSEYLTPYQKANLLYEANMSFEDRKELAEMKKAARGNQDEYMSRAKEENERRIKALPLEKRIIVDVLDAAIEAEKLK